MALVFHGALLALVRTQIDPRERSDRVDPRFAWIGDKAVLEEDTIRGQLFRAGDDAPLFLITSQNFAGVRARSDDARRPGDIFSSFEPVLTVAVNREPPGLVVAPTGSVDPISALQGFRWPFLSRIGRADPVQRAFEARRARIEVRSSETGEIVLAESLSAAIDREAPEVWPDWRYFEMHVAVSETGRLSEPAMLGGGSGSDRVDQYMRDYVRRRMRLDLRLGPGNYRVTVGP